MTQNSAGGTLNVALGNYSLDALTSGDGNTGLGNETLTACTTAPANTAVGYHALGVLVDGNGLNTAVGNRALQAVNTGSSNIGIGYRAGENLTSGVNNILIGRNAAAHSISSTTLDACIVIGDYSDTSAVDSGKQIVIGYNVTGTGNNAFTFGNAALDSNIDFGATSISAPSDVRLKEDIQDEKIGLDFINDLRPVTFQWRKAKDIPEEMKTHVAGSDERVMNGKYNHGFIAQEVKSVIDRYDIKDGFAMWKEDEVDGRQRLADGALVPMLVKSIQELSAKVEAQQSEIDTLKNA
jgi:hypothetical protein